MKRKHGWKPDHRDHRDHVFKKAEGTVLPVKFDLRKMCPHKIQDQGQLGSCTANAIAAAIQFDLLKQGLHPYFFVSRLFVYYNERDMEGTTSTDSGAAIRDGIKTINTLGVCSETLWPYSDANPGPFSTKPSAAAYTEALKARSLNYQSVPQTLDAMKACIVSKTPFVLGFTVYESFESDAVAQTGVVPMPAKGERVMGGHAVLCVGYDDATQRFVCRNSWGASWGMGGYFTIPYAYLTNPRLASDFWAINVMADSIVGAP
jgi:C1A family cysteine protease